MEIISALPIWLLNQTQLTHRTKPAVGLLLSLGAFASVASIIRITQLGSITSSTNHTATSIPIILRSVIDSAANLATLRIPLTAVFPRLGLSSHHGADSSNGRSNGRGPDENNARPPLGCQSQRWLRAPRRGP